MNIFVIPSWYPSKDRPVSGVMIKEQTVALCKSHPHINVGISIWGNKDERNLLWAKDHFKNISKLIAERDKPSSNRLLPNLTEYTKPTFSWTKKILKGNFQNIVKANLYNLDAFVRDYGPVDLIHAHVGHPAGSIAMEVAKRRNLPYCLTEHIGPFPAPTTTDSKGNILPFYKLPFDAAALNIAVSPFQKQRMELQGIENAKVIPNFADEYFFRPANTAKPSSDHFTFLTLSFIAPTKGTGILIEAISKLTAKHKKVKFRIAGEGNTVPFQELAKRLGIEEHIAWLGNIDRSAVLAEYQQADAFVMPSQYESFGIVYIEAIACGKPIIATKCGGPESIVAPVNGLLVDKNNPEALAAAMHDMVINYNRYDSKQIRQDFMNRFSGQAVLPRLVQQYQEIITKTNP
ncbi:glycosyltransferase [Pontibacter harenae]|uniref:glycosyltransferase n=1 Tax=Pontibacter harenae TaxID=2894083 RepID=UPI001E609AA2|nr:glycosyltransferase [Pontibacter harenae]MCC9167767.1 glycosyltransferase [Pontibacter harenae]